jgi:hypothetical protein
MHLTISILIAALGAAVLAVATNSGPADALETAADRRATAHDEALRLILEP